MPWLALTAIVEPRWADAFSDALLWAGAQSASIEAPEGDAPRVSALLAHDAEPAVLVAAAAAHCGLAPAPSFALEALADEDWVRRTQAQFAPLEVGRLWIGASWHTPPAAGKTVVRLDPGLAFGTGSHPTTRLMLEYLERELQGSQSVLDYGCGSGILAIAAAKLGARRVAAVDVDEQAVATARGSAAARGSPAASFHGGASPALHTRLGAACRAGLPASCGAGRLPLSRGSGRHGPVGARAARHAVPSPGLYRAAAAPT
jgi:ribosomal protein L11 methyltransferase